KVLVIMPANDRLGIPRRVRALMDNCLAVTDRLQVEYLSPDLDQERVGELQKEYKFGDRQGLLVVYGSGEKKDSQFIRYDSLLEGMDFMSGNKPRAFTGENALITALDFLKGGKQKPAIYFLQGHGELDITDTRVSQRLDEGVGILKQRLETANYVVKGLQL